MKNTTVITTIDPMRELLLGSATDSFFTSLIFSALSAVLYFDDRPFLAIVCGVLCLLFSGQMFLYAKSYKGWSQLVADCDGDECKAFQAAFGEDQNDIL